MNNLKTDNALEGIAIVGLAGRFPGAKNVEEFWQNLKNGIESISLFSEQELQASGIDPKLIDNPNYIKAKGILEDIELFDAAFFGFSAKEAAITDPQQRLFLECAIEALENAGYNPETYTGAIGVYAGMGMSSYLFNNLSGNEELTNSDSAYQLLIANDKDFLPTRVSYKLNLKGPSINIQTACSTSLVATCMACQSLLNYQCDMALAGGVSISLPQKTGYLYQEGMILSPDGHCRAFDAQARGTVVGNGLGIVVLKRLEEAIADGDTIHAIIKGFAINNDGCLKVGYTAPSVEGQAEVIVQALAMADVNPETITYIEAHGTGTPLGDPIEIAALTKAFRASTQKKGFCAIGSVKTNIGHLDSAAGIAGLIKTVQALKHHFLPPSLHFQTPNPQIDFANSPFYVNTKLTEWQTNGSPRRAGVSSFGIGGTNAHIVLEEAPPTSWQESTKAQNQGRSYQLLVLSAKSTPALDTATSNLLAHLKQHPQLNLADVAYTLAVGRKAFNHRRIVVCSDREDAVAALSHLDAGRVLTHSQSSKQRPIVFMFSGQGSQYLNMGLELYQTEAIFRQQIDKCCQLLKPHLGLDLREILYPDKEKAPVAAQYLQQTVITQPALFVIEYAMAQLWMSWGVHPQAAIGHSLGEYVAACLAGVFCLEQALLLVAARGQLMQQMPPGAMLAISLPQEQARSLLNDNLSIAAINTPSSCVIAGTPEAIDALGQQLLTQKVHSRRLQVSHAFHSQMMKPVLEPLTELVKTLNLNPPQIPYISNLTGTWIAAAEATNPSYWAQHLLNPVRFADGLQQVMQNPEVILLEVGPGRTLSTIAKQHPARQKTALILSSDGHFQDRQSDVVFLLNTLGQLWLAGIEIDWSKFYAGQQRYRVPLPTYPFERQRYWIEPQTLPKKQQTPSNSWLWKTAVEAGYKQALADISKFDCPSYWTKQKCLDRLCVANMNFTLRKLGAFANPALQYSLQDLLQKFPILPRHEQLLSRWLQVLVEHGQLQQQGEVFRNLLPLSVEAFEALVTEVKLRWADNPLWVEPVLQASQKLPVLLTGQENSLNLLFSQDSLEHTERIARDCPILPYYNAIARRILECLVESIPSQVKLRILEIGAGMGLTTKDLLPVVPPQQATYVYTDVSRLFLDRAKQKFGDYPFVEYRLLDMEQSPQKQGYQLHSFDAIVAANVLHVAQNIGETLDRVRSLLAPGGILLIWEVTQPQLYFDTIDGLLMKPLHDGERTQTNPFLSPKQWQKALLEHGFVQVAAIPETDIFGYHIFLAQASASDGSVAGAFTQTSESKQDTTCLAKKSDIADWFCIPSWKRSPIPIAEGNFAKQRCCWLVFVDDCGLGDGIVKQLELAGQDAIAVRVGEEFGSDGQKGYKLNPCRSQDYDKLWQQLYALNKMPQFIIHLWSVTPNELVATAFERLEKLQNLGFWSLLFLAQAIGKQDLNARLEIAVISNHLQQVTGEEKLYPEKATLLGPCKVIPQEYVNINCRSIDIVLPEPETEQQQKLINNLLVELTIPTNAIQHASRTDVAIAYRGNYRWVQTFVPVRLDESYKQTPRLRNGGVYLITGGLGGIGLVLAEYLAKTVQAKLVLVGRSPFPVKDEWERWLHTHDEQDSISAKIRKIQAMELLGAKVVVESADVTNFAQMQAAIAQACKLGGTIHGVIHAAGVISGGTIQLKTPKMAADVLAPKVMGTLVLDALVRDFDLDFFILCSSLNSFLAPLGLVDHCAGNSFLDAFANYKATTTSYFDHGSCSWGGTPASAHCLTLITSVNWDGWQEVGQATQLRASAQLQLWRDANFQKGILPLEGIEAFNRILGTRLPQVLVSTQDFLVRFEQFNKTKELQQIQSQQKANSTASIHSRPKLTQAYVPPRNQLEQTIAQIWQQSLGVEPIGIKDDFFELGGDSLIAVHLIAKISEATQTKLSPHSLIDAPTIAGLAELILASQPANLELKPKLPPTLVEIQSGGSKPPLFLVHPVGGHVYIYRDLAHYLGSKQPVYGLQAQAIDGNSAFVTRVEEMATQYIEAIRVVQPQGPYFLGGSSFGGTVAYEMAQQLRAQGEKIGLLALIDTPGVGHMPSENIDNDDIKIMAYALGVGANLADPTEQLQQLCTEEQLHYFLEKGKMALRMPADFGIDELRRHHNLFKINLKAMRNYVPQPYPGRVIFFRASLRDPFNPQNPELGWQNLAMEGLEIHEVPGNHITMNFPPHVQVMAEWFKVYLQN